MLFEGNPGDDARAGLKGIARLAANSPVLESKQQVEYLQIETRSFVGRCSGTRMPFVWTVNPYRGCEFGCKYCYARFAHEFMELRDPSLFERRIYAKKFDAATFRAELRKVRVGEAVWIGTATDPYQPAERRFGITRAMLRILADEHRLTLGVTSKSDLIARDAELLAQIAQQNRLDINITVTTLDPSLARALEPLAPRPDLRLAAVRKLAGLGVRVSVLANPVMPLITDSDENLESVCRAAKEAGAWGFRANPLFLKPCAQAVFFPFLESAFPHLLRRYRERFAAHSYLRGSYPQELRERVRAITVRYGMNLEYEEVPPQWDGPQLTLW